MDPAVKAPKDPLALVTKAATYAAQAHKDHKRKVNGEPYINHLLRVADSASRAGLSCEVVAAAILHDIVEDTEVTLEDLAREFPHRVVQIVDILTQTWDDRASVAERSVEEPKYVARILADKDAIHLKLLDRSDNLRDMAAGPKRFRSWGGRYMDRTQLHLAAVLDACTNSFVRETYLDAVKAMNVFLERP